MKTTNAYIIKTTNANFKCVTTNMDEYKKKTQNFLKPQIFLFFWKVLSMCTQITNENTDNSAT